MAIRVRAAPRGGGPFPFFVGPAPAGIVLVERGTTMTKPNLIETPYGTATVLFLNKRVRTSTTVLLDSCGEWTIGGVRMVVSLLVTNYCPCAVGGFERSRDTESDSLHIGRLDRRPFVGRDTTPLDVDDAVRNRIRDTLTDTLNEWAGTDGYAGACRDVEREAVTDAANGRGPDPCFGK